MNDYLRTNSTAVHGYLEYRLKVGDNYLEKGGVDYLAASDAISNTKAADNQSVIERIKAFLKGLFSTEISAQEGTLGAVIQRHRGDGQKLSLSKSAVPVQLVAFRIVNGMKREEEVVKAGLYNPRKNRMCELTNNDKNAVIDPSINGAYRDLIDTGNNLVSCFKGMYFTRGRRLKALEKARKAYDKAFHNFEGKFNFEHRKAMASCFNDVFDDTGYEETRTELEELQAKYDVLAKRKDSDGIKQVNARISELEIELEKRKDRTSSTSILEKLDQAHDQMMRHILKSGLQKNVSKRKALAFFAKNLPLFSSTDIEDCSFKVFQNSSRIGSVSSIGSLGPRRDSSTSSDYAASDSTDSVSSIASFPSVAESLEEVARNYRDMD